jgi:iron-sulfur cluster repair protein YtfE (RIC family)
MQPAQTSLFLAAPIDHAARARSACSFAPPGMHRASVVRYTGPGRSQWLQARGHLGGTVEATKLLIKQHRKVQSLFRKLARKNGDAEALLTELANDLAAHMAIEQDLFYPAVQQIDDKLVLESYEEHALAEVALKRLLATNPDDDAFLARVTALKELIEHHVKEEEEDLFPKVEKKLESERLRALGKEMQTRFDEVVEQGYEAALPKGFGKTSSDLSKRSLRGKSRRAA